MTLTVLQADDLKALSKVSHAFLGRTGGVSTGIYESLNCGQHSHDDRASVEENRRRVAAYFGITAENLVSCKQIHCPKVVTVTEPWTHETRPEADAMVTNNPGIALGVLTADCVPVLFVDDQAAVIGAAHAGWRGAIGGVLENTVETMKALGANPRTMRAAIGPCIGPNSYEVGPEFPAPFLAEDPLNQKFFGAAARIGHYMFDLPGYVAAKLRKLGLGSVAPSPADTCNDDARFFSYRRNTLRGEKRVASGISVIMLKTN